MTWGMELFNKDSSPQVYGSEKAGIDEWLDVKVHLRHLNSRADHCLAELGQGLAEVDGLSLALDQGLIEADGLSLALDQALTESDGLLLALRNAGFE